MAIDTEEKRRSALGFNTVLPVAKGSVTGRDGRHLAWIYAGYDTPSLYALPYLPDTGTAILNLPYTTIAVDLPYTTEAA